MQTTASDQLPDSVGVNTAVASSEPSSLPADVDLSTKSCPQFTGVVGIADSAQPAQHTERGNPIQRKVTFGPVLGNDGTPPPNEPVNTDIPNLVASDNSTLQVPEVATQPINIPKLLTVVLTVASVVMLS